MLIGFLCGVLLVESGCLIALGYAVYNLSVEVKGMSNSTHQIMMPSHVAGEMFQTLDDETKQKMVRPPADYDSIQ
jgi:hypothetical protein